MGKDGEDVAVVDTSGHANAFGFNNNIQVSGSLQCQGKEKGFLQAAISNPHTDQLGEFQCEINTIIGHHAVEFSQTLEAGVTEPEIKDLVNIIAGMKSVEAGMLSTIETLKSNEQKMKKNITDLFFSACVTTGHFFVNDSQPVIYNTVYSN